MQWTIVDDLMVCVTSADTPDATTLATFLDDLRTKPVRRILSTPLSASAELDGERQACAEVCLSRSIKVALLVDAGEAAAYAACSAMTSSSLASFSWDEVEAALTHLDVGGPQASGTRAALATMRNARAAIAA